MYVSRIGARKAQQLLEMTMFREALARTNGNRHAAARVLGVDRRVLAGVVVRHTNAQILRAASRRLD